MNTQSKVLPIISSIMPCYNSESYILEAVNSILTHTEENWELLVMDDCSTDSTLDLLKSINDCRVKVFQSESKLGQAEQMNKGIKLARGKYIAVCHSDDINYPNRFKEQVEILEGSPDLVAVGSAIEYFGIKKGSWAPPIEHDDCFYEMLLDSPFAHPTVMMKKDAYNSLSEGYKQEMVPAEDYELWTRLVSTGSFANCSQTLLKYRINLIRSQYVETYFNVNSVHYTQELIHFLTHSKFITVSDLYELKKKIKSISEQNPYLNGKWKLYIYSKLADTMLKTKRHGIGAGIYFLIVNPTFMIRGNLINSIRLIVRSLR